MHEAYTTEIHSIRRSIIIIVHIPTTLNSSISHLHPIPDCYKPLYSDINQALATCSPQIIIAQIFASITPLFMKLPCGTLK